MPVIPFKIEHFELLQLREQESRRLAVDPNSMAKIAALAKHGHGGTVLLDGRILGIIGFYELWPGCLEIWAFPSVHAAQHPIPWVRTCRRFIETIEQTYTLRRIQSTSLNDELHINWMTCLGLTCETPEPMRQYFADGSDALMWSKVYAKT